MNQTNAPTIGEGSPRPVQPVNGAAAAVGLVHLPDLGRDQEPGHRRDDDVDHEPKDAADAAPEWFLTSSWVLKTQ